MYTSGGSGIKIAWPVYLDIVPGASGAPDTYSYKLVPAGNETPLSTITSTSFMFDKYGQYDKSATTQSNIFLGLSVNDSKTDRVGITSASPAWDAAPKTLTITHDRDDIYTSRFLDRYCLPRRPGQAVVEEGLADPTLEYESRLQITSTAESTSTEPGDLLFCVWISSPIGNMNAVGTYRNIIYGLFTLSSASPNFSTAFNTRNSFSYVYTAVDNKYPLNVLASELWTSQSTDFTSMIRLGSGGGRETVRNNDAYTNWQDLFGSTYNFTLPVSSGMLQDTILLDGDTI